MPVALLCSLNKRMRAQAAYHSTVVRVAGIHPSTSRAAGSRLAWQGRASFVLDRVVVVVACQEMHAWRQSNVSEQLSRLGSIASPVFSLAAFPGCWSYLSSQSPLACRQLTLGSLHAAPARLIALDSCRRRRVLGSWLSGSLPVISHHKRPGVLRISWMHATAN
jgi:hypothetical protein